MNFEGPGTQITISLLSTSALGMNEQNYDLLNQNPTSKLQPGKGSESMVSGISELGSHYPVLETSFLLSSISSFQDWAWNPGLAHTNQMLVRCSPPFAVLWLASLLTSLQLRLHCYSILYHLTALLLELDGSSAGTLPCTVRISYFTRYQFPFYTALSFPPSFNVLTLSMT